MSMVEGSVQPVALGCAAHEFSRCATSNPSEKSGERDGDRIRVWFDKLETSWLEQLHGPVLVISGAEYTGAVQAASGFLVNMRR